MLFTYSPIEIWCPKNFIGNYTFGNNWNTTSAGVFHHLATSELGWTLLYLRFVYQWRDYSWCSLSAHFSLICCYGRDALYQLIGLQGKKETKHALCPKNIHLPFCKRSKTFCFQQLVGEKKRNIYLLYIILVYITLAYIKFYIFDSNNNKWITS